MYKQLSLLVLLALVAVVFSVETQDQQTSEQFLGLYGYPYGYNPALLAGVRGLGYTGLGYTGLGYPYGINTPLAYAGAYPGLLGLGGIYGI